MLANITLDPLDKELERHGHRFARYADDFLVMVKSAKAAERVMASLTRFVEGRLKRVVNRAKSKAASLSSCTMKAAPAPPPPPALLGHPAQGGAPGHAEPQGVLADELE